MRILVTGCAGFIGSNLSRTLLDKSHSILGIDSLSDYYSKTVKANRIKVLHTYKDFDFQNLDLATVDMKFVIKKYSPDVIIHLAAQPGVRLATEDYWRYTRDNLVAFNNVAVSACQNNVQNMLYASSSSVYGDQKSDSFHEKLTVPRPSSFYGATKLANEILISTLSSSKGLRARGLRFFTVYGPNGRPDMAYTRLIGSAIHNFPFMLSGDGSIERDFTFIEDVVEIVEKLMEDLLRREPGWNDVVNIGGGRPVSINQLIEIVTNQVKKRPNVVSVARDLNDVQRTCADFGYLAQLVGNLDFKNVDFGMEKTIKWAKKVSSRQFQDFLGIKID